MGNYGDGEIFVATNATNFPQGVTNGTLIVGVSDWEECNPDAQGRASEFQVEDPVTFNVNELGMIEGEKGWHAQPIRELEGNSTMPVSLAELVSGSGSEHVLAVYLLSSDEELLGCAFLKKHDENTAAEYGSVVAGGRLNVASGSRSVVSGGEQGVASGFASSVSGGRLRTAGGSYNWVGGSLFESN